MLDFLEIVAAISPHKMAIITPNTKDYRYHYRYISIIKYDVSIVIAFPILCMYVCTYV